MFMMVSSLNAQTAKICVDMPDGSTLCFDSVESYQSHFGVSSFQPGRVVTRSRTVSRPMFGMGTAVTHVSTVNQCASPMFGFVQRTRWETTTEMREVTVMKPVKEMREVTVKKPLIVTGKLLYPFQT